MPLGNPEGAVPPSYPIGFRLLFRRRLNFPNRYSKCLADAQARSGKPVRLLYLLGGCTIPFGNDPEGITAFHHVGRGFLPFFGGIFGGFIHPCFGCGDIEHLADNDKISPVEVIGVPDGVITGSIAFGNL